MHVATPLVGEGQGVHDAPHVASSRSSAHAPPHSWKPGSHCQPHAMPSQVAVALTGEGQALHDVPHPSALVFATHALPHAWNPASQATPQLPRMHDASPFAGTGHASPQLPQFCTLACRSMQLVPHALWPSAQLLTQVTPPAFVLQSGCGAVHVRPHEPQCAGVERSASQPFVSLPSPAPSQSACVSRQLVPHVVPSQVARVLGGTGQGVHDAPHEFVSAFGRHASPQTWLLASQATPQIAPSQMAVAPGGAGQAVHEVPQLSVSLFDTQTPPQS